MTFMEALVNKAVQFEVTAMYSYDEESNEAPNPYFRTLKDAGLWEEVEKGVRRALTEA